MSTDELLAGCKGTYVIEDGFLGIRGNLSQHEWWDDCGVVAQHLGIHHTQHQGDDSPEYVVLQVTLGKETHPFAILGGVLTFWLVRRACPDGSPGAGGATYMVSSPPGHPFATDIRRLTAVNWEPLVRDVLNSKKELEGAPADVYQAALDLEMAKIHAVWWTEQLAALQRIVAAIKEAG